MVEFHWLAAGVAEAAVAGGKADGGVYGRDGVGEFLVSVYPQ